MMVSLSGSPVYPTVQSPTTPGQQSYPGGVTNWSRASFIPSPRWQGPSSYAPVIVPQGVVSVPGWGAYSVSFVTPFGAKCNDALIFHAVFFFPLHSIWKALMQKLLSSNSWELWNMGMVIFPGPGWLHFIFREPAANSGKQSGLWNFTPTWTGEFRISRGLFSIPVWLHSCRVLCIAEGKCISWETWPTRVPVLHEDRWL